MISQSNYRSQLNIIVKFRKLLLHISTRTWCTWAELSRKARYTAVPHSERGPGNWGTPCLWTSREEWSDSSEYITCIHMSLFVHVHFPFASFAFLCFSLLGSNQSNRPLCILHPILFEVYDIMVTACVSVKFYCTSALYYPGYPSWVAGFIGHSMASFLQRLSYFSRILLQ